MSHLQQPSMSMSGGLLVDEEMDNENMIVFEKLYF